MPIKIDGKCKVMDEMDARDNETMKRMEEAKGAKLQEVLKEEVKNHDAKKEEVKKEDVKKEEVKKEEAKKEKYEVKDG